MSNHLLREKYIGKNVLIKNTRSTIYERYGIVGEAGIVTQVSGGSIGVKVDGIYNESSSYGVFWLLDNDVEIINEESEDIKMTGFNKLAVVNLLEDSCKRNYYFALYDEEAALIKYLGSLVVVNAKKEENRLLGVLIDIIPVTEYNKTVTAQVVGVVNMDGYESRIAEAERLKEIAKKKFAIEKELEEEINKRKTIDYYEEMASRYSDNPRLAELVAELKGLGV